MPRRLRMASGGYVYHVLNRTVGRARLFDKSGDYAAFEKVFEEAKEWLVLRLLAYCVMPNHWHLILWPEQDGDLSEFMRWLTVTQGEQTKLGRVTRGHHQHGHERRGERSDGDIPFKAAFERHWSESV